MQQADFHGTFSLGEGRDEGQWGCGREGRCGAALRAPHAVAEGEDEEGEEANAEHGLDGGEEAGAPAHWLQGFAK